MVALEIDSYNRAHIGYGGQVHFPVQLFKKNHGKKLLGQIIF